MGFMHEETYKYDWPLTIMQYLKLPKHTWNTPINSVCFEEFPLSLASDTAIVRDGKRTIASGGRLKHSPMAWTKLGESIIYEKN